MIIDSHCHLNFCADDEVEQIIESANSNGVEQFINIGTSLIDSQKAIEQAQKYSQVFATVGVHPNDNLDLTAENIDWDKFSILCQQPKVVAVGECGLDYSHFENNTNRDLEINRQTKIFAKQIAIANQFGLPLIIHVRDAYEDMLKIAPSINVPTVFHCMSGTSEYLNALLAMCHPGQAKRDPGSTEIDSGSKAGMTKVSDFYFSFAGNVTFKNAQNIRDLAQNVPMDRLLIETDSPFLSPVPLRGTQNSPANVKIVGQYLAELKKTSFDEFANLTTQNTKRLFKI